MRTPSLSATMTQRFGLTIAELLIVMAIVAMMLTLLLPSIRSARGPARRTQCLNNSKNVVLAILNYESAHQKLPMAVGAFDEGVPVDSVHFRRHSGFVSLLPFVEESDLWDAIENETEIDGVAYPPMGAAAFDEDYPHWKRELAVFLCPSSPLPETGFGLTNYAFCIGDSVTDIHRPSETSRGPFGFRKSIPLTDITDGTRHTIAVAEVGTRRKRSRGQASVAGQFATMQSADFLTNPFACRNTLDPSNSRYYKQTTAVSEIGRGGRWSDGSAGYTLFNTVLGPNSPSCAVGGTDGVDGIYSAGSYHESDGITVAMLDGSCHFFLADIDAGDGKRVLSPDDGNAESPYGIWGALGTVAGNEQHSESF